MAPPIRTRSSFPLSQSLPSGSFPKPLILLHQRADRLKTTIRKLTNLITCTIALSNSWNYEPCSEGPPKTDRLCGEFWKNVVHWRKEWQTTSVFLPWEPHEQYEKEKWKDTERGTPQVSKVPNMLLEISGEITPERMKGWRQSKNNTQLRIWLVIEARSDAVKSNIA